MCHSCHVMSSCDAVLCHTMPIGAMLCNYAFMPPILSPHTPDTPAPLRLGTTVKAVMVTLE